MEYLDGVNEWMEDGVFVLMEYCIYCSGVFGWVDEWMDGVLDGWMNGWMEYLDAWIDKIKYKLSVVLNKWSLKLEP